VIDSTKLARTLLIRTAKGMRSAQLDVAQSSGKVLEAIDRPRAIRRKTGLHRGDRVFALHRRRSPAATNAPSDTDGGLINPRDSYLEVPISQKSAALRHAEGLDRCVQDSAADQGQPRPCGDLGEGKLNRLRSVETAGGL